MNRLKHFVRKMGGFGLFKCVVILAGLIVLLVLDAGRRMPPMALILLGGFGLPFAFRDALARNVETVG